MLLVLTGKEAGDQKRQDHKNSELFTGCGRIHLALIALLCHRRVSIVCYETNKTEET
jgi:hypothetical protein